MPPQLVGLAQPSAVQTCPRQLPPVQDVPTVALAAQLRASHAAPKMSCSPSSMTPVTGSTTWLVPRAPSSVPWPVEAGKLWAYAAGRPCSSSSTARLTSIRPLPCAGCRSSGSR